MPKRKISKQRRVQRRYRSDPVEVAKAFLKYEKQFDRQQEVQEARRKRQRRRGRGRYRGRGRGQIRRNGRGNVLRKKGVKFQGLLRSWTARNCWWDVSDSRINRRYRMNYPTLQRTVAKLRKAIANGIEQLKIYEGRDRTLDEFYEKKLCDQLHEVEDEFGIVTWKSITNEVNRNFQTLRFNSLWVFICCFVYFCNIWFWQLVAVIDQ